MTESLQQKLWQGGPVMVNVAFDPPKVLLAFAAFFRACFTKRA